MQTPGSSVPPFQAATVAGNLYKSCACLRPQYVMAVNWMSTIVIQFHAVHSAVRRAENRRGLLTPLDSLIPAILAPAFIGEL